MCKSFQKLCTILGSLVGKLGKCCSYLQYFLYNIDNDKSKQKYTQSHSSYKIELKGIGSKFFYCFM